MPGVPDRRVILDLMHYPFWFVPLVPSTMLIAAVAVVHMYVALYAVGGGIFLAREIAWARRTGDAGYLECLRDHSGFFVLLTMVLGTMTGVGIWWTIGLASPLPTEFLIHTFVFGWGMEYVFFLVEIVSAFTFYYGWDRMPDRAHTRAVRIYAAAAWISLVIITPITGFMLNPGAWGGSFWRAFANPQAVPQILGRTGGALILACLYVYLHAALRAKPGVRETVVRRAGPLALAGAVLLLAGLGGSLLNLPESARRALEGAPVINVLTAVAGGSAVLLVVLLAASSFRFPGWVSPGYALALFAFGLAAIGAAEFVREGIRKPFVIHGTVYSTNLYPSEVAGLRKDGLLATGIWTRRWLAGEFPQLADHGGRVRTVALARLSPSDRKRVGRAVFMYHCAYCHSEAGYMGMRELLPGWNPEMLSRLVRDLDRYRFVMPPWSGGDAEAEALAAFLATLARPHPLGEAPDGR